MTRETQRDDFEGIDINGPWGGIRIGAGGVRMGSWANDDWGDDDSDIRKVRRRVRQKLDFYKNLVFFSVISGVCLLADGLTGDGLSWSIWVSAFLGAWLAFQLLGTFIAPALWGREAEERMVRREVERRRGRVHVTPAGGTTPRDGDSSDDPDGHR